MTRPKTLLSWQSHNAGKKYARHADRIYWDGHSAYVRVPVPADLRPRDNPRQHYPQNTVVRYLGTSSATEAKRRAPSAITAILEEFEAKRRGPADASTTLAALLQVRDVFRSQAFDDLAEGARPEEIFGNADVAGALKGMGVTLANRRVGLATFMAQWGQALAIKRVENRAGPPPAPTPWRRPTSSEPIQDGAFTITAALETFARVRDLKPRSLKQSRQSVRLFVEHVGADKLAIDVTPEDATAFKDKLARISPDYRRAIRNGVSLTLAEMETQFAAPLGKGLSNETINRHLSNFDPCSRWRRRVVCRRITRTHSRKRALRSQREDDATHRMTLRSLRCSRERRWQRTG